MVAPYNRDPTDILVDESQQPNTLCLTHRGYDVSPHYKMYQSENTDLTLFLSGGSGGEACGGEEGGEEEAGGEGLKDGGLSSLSQRGMNCGINKRMETLFSAAGSDNIC